MENEKNVKKEEEVAEKKPRQILIETDGNSVVIKTAEVAGTLELVGILEAVIKQIKK